jgi:hypothetical protein
MKNLSLLLLCVVPLLSCTTSNEVVDFPEARITLKIFNLPPVPEGEGHYTLWATFFSFNKNTGTDSPLHDEGFINLGRFMVLPGDSLAYALDGGPAQFRIPDTLDAQLLDDIKIAIQPEDHHGVAKVFHEEEPGPGIVGGRFYGDAVAAHAEMTPTYADALGSDFSTARAYYSIMAPTSTTPADSNSGLWFYNNSGPGLSGLPELTEGWTYQGWVRENAGSSQTYYSTGTFTRADTADADGAGPGSGPGTALNVPGQDFLTGTPARPNLRDSSHFFFVTVEPVPDNSPNPFFLKILSNEPAVAVEEHVHSLPILDNVAAWILPRARVTILR